MSGIRKRRSSLSGHSLAWPWLLLVFLAGLCVLRRHLTVWPLWSSHLQPCTLLTLRMLLRASPFVLLGSTVATLIHFYLTDAALRQLLPRSRSLGLVRASLLSLAFPMSGANAAVMAERLAQQGVSVGAISTFLLAAPAVNPIVLAATYQAFGGSWGVTLLRGLCAWLLAICLGDLIGRLHPESEVLRQSSFYQRQPTMRFAADSNQVGRPSLMDLLRQTCRQIYGNGSWLIVGALLVSAWQTLVPMGLKQAAGQFGFLTIPLFMFIAWMLSVGPESDAFLISTLSGQFGASSLLAWLLLGPIVNLCHLRRLRARFDHDFVHRLSIWAAGSVLVIAVLANLCGIGGRALPVSSSVLAVTGQSVIRQQGGGLSLNQDYYLPAGPLSIEADNFLEMMEMLWAAGDEIIGRQVEMTGFVYSDPTLGSEDFVLARMMAVDQSGEEAVAGLLCRWTERSNLADGQWLSVQGKLGRLSFYDLAAGQLRSMPFIQVEQLSLLESPAGAGTYPDWR